MRVKTLIAALLALSLCVLFLRKEENKDTEGKSPEAKLNKNSFAAENLLFPVPDYQKVQQKVKDIADKENFSEAQRMAFVYDLQLSKISKNDEEFLRYYLRNNDPDDSYAVKNDVVEYLVRSSQEMNLTEKTLYHLLSLSNDEVLREYILQYIPEFYDNCFSHFRDADFSKFNNLLFDLLNENNSSIAGASLFALYKISRNFPEVEKSEVLDNARQILADRSSSSSSRIASAQLLFDSNLAETDKLLRKISFAENEPVLLRMAAIKSLEKRKVADLEFINFLKELKLKSDDSRLVYLASVSLKNLNKNQRDSSE